MRVQGTGSALCEYKVQGVLYVAGVCYRLARYHLCAVPRPSVYVLMPSECRFCQTDPHINVAQGLANYIGFHYTETTTAQASMVIVLTLAINSNCCHVRQCSKLMSVRRPMADDSSSGLTHFEKFTLKSALMADKI